MRFPRGERSFVTHAGSRPVAAEAASDGKLSAPDPAAAKRLQVQRLAPGDQGALVGSAEGPALTREATDAELPVMQRIGIAMFLIGALNVLLTEFVFEPNNPDQTSQVTCAALLIAAAALIGIGPPRRLAIQLATFFGIAVLSALCATAQPLGETPYFFLWPVVFSAYYFPRRLVYAALAEMCLGFALALLLWAHATQKVMIFITVLSVVSVMTLLILVSRERQRRLTAQLYVASTTDPLTGLLNRRAFQTALVRELDRAETSNLDLSLVSFDLDHFKACNDRHGHAAGDQVLVHFAHSLRTRLRPGDIAARVGGEEFVAVLFDTSGCEAQGFAEELGRELLSCQQEAAGGEVMSFSAGISSLHGCSPPDDLLILADRALYAAKGAGRRRVARWKDGIQLGGAAYDPALSPSN